MANANTSNFILDVFQLLDDVGPSTIALTCLSVFTWVLAAMMPEVERNAASTAQEPDDPDTLAGVGWDADDCDEWGSACARDSAECDVRLSPDFFPEGRRYLTPVRPTHSQE